MGSIQKMGSEYATGEHWQSQPVSPVDQHIFPGDNISPNEASRGSEPLPPPPIAICGMALRLPGGLKDAKGLWDFLLEKKDARSKVPATRFNIDSFHRTAKKTGSIVTQHGYFLEDVDLSALDTSFFSMGRDELAKMDPQQRQFLEVTRECLESANEVNWAGKAIGCYVGVYGEDWLDSYAKDLQQWGLNRIAGTADFAIANRASYEFDFKGPRYVSSMTRVPSEQSKSDFPQLCCQNRLFLSTNRLERGLPCLGQRRLFRSHCGRHKSDLDAQHDGNDERARNTEPRRLFQDI
jgi:hypothetical protein